MPPRSEEEKARRRAVAEQKRQERAAAKKLQEEEEARQLAQREAKKAKFLAKQQALGNKFQHDGNCYILELLPESLLQLMWTYLPAKELGAAATLTCRQWSSSLAEARVTHVQSQLGSTLCETKDEARLILKQSYGGGNTGRVVTKKERKSDTSKDEFISYARFLQEGVVEYCPLDRDDDSDDDDDEEEDILVPGCIEGRFASASPEHSLTRMGGDGDTCGAGGSGVASWGVGRRGQLGNGQREDVALPKMIQDFAGYNRIRIVQVAAGGGLVRVAHSLFLSSQGQVYSCGNNSYGQLGHGYTGSKQLPDYIKPRVVDAFQGMKMVCVSAGEIHSAAVNSDGDLFTFGDGFLGMLGHGDKRPQVSPKQVLKGGLEDECVSIVACGCRHTLVVTEEGEAWSMGLGHFGVLGRAFTPYEYNADTALDNLGGLELEVDEGFAGLAAEPVAPPPPVVVAARDIADPVLRAERERAELAAQIDLIANLTLDDPSNQCIPMVIDSLEGIKIVGASAGHRHSMLLDDQGDLYTCGSGVTGALGHGDKVSQMYPMKVMELVDQNIKVRQFSAGVDLSMAVATNGTVYSWGKSDGGRLGLGNTAGIVDIPRPVRMERSDGEKVKVIDVECGYVHSLLVAVDGTLHICGGVGIDGASDGQQQDKTDGTPVQLDDLNIWHRIPEPKEVKKVEKWKKYGTYELQGRSKMMASDNN